MGGLQLATGQEPNTELARLLNVRQNLLKVTVFGRDSLC